MYEGKRGREAEFMNAGDLVLLHLANRRRMDMRRGNLRDTSDGKERDASFVAPCNSSSTRDLSSIGYQQAIGLSLVPFIMLCTNWIISIDHKVPISTQFWRAFRRARSVEILYPR